MLPLRASSSSSRTPAAAITMSTRGVVITGGAAGVGYAYADELMERGHWVVICDIKDPADAVKVLREKHAGGVGRIEGTVCDVADAKSVEELAQFAKEKIGTVHYWINNAGINGGRRPFTSLSTSTVEAVVKVNLVGVLVCTKVALDLMQSQNGVTSHVRDATVATRRRLFLCVSSDLPVLSGAARRSSTRWALASKAAAHPGTQPTARPSVACRS